MDETEQCPICNEQFPVVELIEHAQHCMGAEPTPPSSPFHDPDYEYALKLQKEMEQEAKSSPRPSNPPPQMLSDEELARQLDREEKKNSSSNGIKCQSCGKVTETDNVYILDECGHRFCKGCLEAHVTEQIHKSVNIQCPLPDCVVLLSVRDTKDLLPLIKQKMASTSKGGYPFNPKKASADATARLMAEFKHLSASSPEENGYSAEPVDDNLYKWEITLFGFDKNDPLGQDMAKFKVKEILLHAVFPSNYPFAPPYIRVIRPRFQFRTGHVTVGGSICMEILTNKGWAQLIAGGARLDGRNKHDYTEQEAREAFDRMVREHGWF